MAISDPLAASPRRKRARLLSRAPFDGVLSVSTNSDCVGVLRDDSDLMSLSVVGQKVELRSEIEISASADVVWEVLTNFGGYGEWNPYIVEAAGELKEGAVITTTINFPGSRERTFKRRITKLVVGEELCWSWTSFMRAVAQSEQYFRLQPVSDTRLRLTVGENLSGLLAPREPAQLSQISQGLTLMTQAIKRRSDSVKTG